MTMLCVVNNVGGGTNCSVPAGYPVECRCSAAILPLGFLLTIHVLLYQKLLLRYNGNGFVSFQTVFLVSRLSSQLILLRANH